MKQRIVSGITATGQLTIGNYIGAIRNIVKLQDEYDLFIFVADLHALTINISAQELHQNRKNIIALYVAAGLDPQKATIFYQSDILEHGTMSWIMENMTTIGELERMTQFKDKSNKDKQANGTTMIKTGLLTYPALMAGDILLYKPHLVPVGLDQKQHLELTRNIAQRFNNKNGLTFDLPQPYIPKLGGKIMSLSDPTKKMSKSDPLSKSYIALLDDPELAFNKIKKAVTDSEGKIYIDDHKPGIKNLLTIFATLNDLTLEQVAQQFKDKNYGELKNQVGLTVKSFLIKLQKKYHETLEQVDIIAQHGAKNARHVANQTLMEIKAKIGL